MPSPIATIDGATPRATATPSSVDELRTTLQEASHSGKQLLLAGHHTKMDWGRPPESVDVAIELGALPCEIEHWADDLVVRATASVTLEELQRELSTRGQRLCVDTLIPSSTLGGLVATAPSGPLRYGYGAIRDLLIGVGAVRVDGTLTRSGGRVVKNVAGYDLAKLYTGSYGTLAAVTEVFLRLHALPEESQYLTVAVPIDNLGPVVAALTHSTVAPSAIELHGPLGERTLTLSVLIEGLAKGVPIRQAGLERALGLSFATSTSAPDWWSSLPGSTTLKVTHEVASLPQLVQGLYEIADRHQIHTELKDSIGIGVCHLGIDALATLTLESAGQVLGEIRMLATALGGSAIILRAPVALRTAMDPFGSIPALDLMRRVKAQFDPQQLLARGRFVGGI